jgi:hypothetical protein
MRQQQQFMDRVQRPGVLVVTTKKGKIGTAKVNYDGWFGITKPFKLWDVLNAEQ